MFDKDRKGVPVKELRHAMKSIGTETLAIPKLWARIYWFALIGEKVTDAEFDELLKELGVPKDGKVTVDQFLKVLPKKWAETE